MDKTSTQNKNKSSVKVKVKVKQSKKKNQIQAKSSSINRKQGALPLVGDLKKNNTIVQNVTIKNKSKSKSDASKKLVATINQKATIVNIKLQKEGSGGVQPISNNYNPYQVSVPINSNNLMNAINTHSNVVGAVNSVTAKENIVEPIKNEIRQEQAQKIVTPVSSPTSSYRPYDFHFQTENSPSKFRGQSYPIQNTVKSSSSVLSGGSSSERDETPSYITKSAYSKKIFNSLYNSQSRGHNQATINQASTSTSASHSDFNKYRAEFYAYNQRFSEPNVNRNSKSELHSLATNMARDLNNSTLWDKVNGAKRGSYYTSLYTMVRHILD